MRFGFVFTSARSESSEMIILGWIKGRLKLKITKSLQPTANSWIVVDEIISQRFKFSFRSFWQCRAINVIDLSVT